MGMYVNVITNMTRFIANFRIHQIRRRLIREIRSEGAQEPGGRLDDSHSAKVRHERHVTRWIQVFFNLAGDYFKLTELLLRAAM